MQLGRDEPGVAHLLDAANRASLDENYALARDLYDQAAKAGSTEALYELSVIYKNGYGVQPDLGRAKTYFETFVSSVRQKANSGDAVAQRRLSRLLQYGDGVLKNEDEAVHWLKKAANQGLGEAQFHLSRLYAYGWCGLQENPAAADLWLSKAVEARYPEALYTKGVEQANRYFVTKDSSAMVAAIDWLEQAVNAGFDEASTVLKQLLQTEEQPPKQKE